MDKRAQMLADSIEQLQEDIQYEDDEDISVRTGWAIQNVQSLEWALSRDGALKAEKDRIMAAYDEAKRRLEARRDQLLDKIQRGIAFFESRIARYAEDNRDALLGGGAKKSVALLNGVVGWRRKTGRLVVVDEKALVAWLQAQPNTDLYRVKIEPAMVALQKNYEATKQVPPGMEYAEEFEKFYIEPANVGTDLLRKP
jgi:phage host-nuclease inhibitor protein Gam